MKRILQAVTLLLISFVAAPLFAMEKNIVDDVIRMTAAGVSEDAIVEFVHKSDVRWAISADDMIAMTDAKVSRFVMKALLDEADRNGVNRDRQSSDRRTVERETVVVSPAYAAPYYYPSYYDPFWYAPRLSLNFGYGFGYGYGHGYGYGSRGGSYRGGGGHGGGSHRGRH